MATQAAGIRVLYELCFQGGNQFFQPVFIDFAIIAGDGDDFAVCVFDSDIQRRRESTGGRSEIGNARVALERLKSDLSPVVVALIDDF